MRRIALVAAFIVCIVVVSANSSLAGDIWPVGTIIQSILEENPFQDQMGSEWVLMDGRPVSKSDEISSHLDGTTDASGNILLPDARGKFLRMIDDRSDAAERAEKGDPEANRILGGYQADIFQGHYHNANARGDTGTGGVGTIIPLNRKLNGGGNMVTDGVYTPITDGTNGSPRYGIETRPKNIAVNYFIKVRKCQSAECK